MRLLCRRKTSTSLQVCWTRSKPHPTDPTSAFKRARARPPDRSTFVLHPQKPPPFKSAAIAAKDKVYGTNSPRLMRAVGMAYSSRSKGTSCSNRVTSKRSVSSFLNISKTISSPRQHSSPKPSCPLVTCEAVKNLYSTPCTTTSHLPI